MDHSGTIASHQRLVSEPQEVSVQSLWYTSLVKALISDGRNELDYFLYELVVIYLSGPHPRL